MPALFASCVAAMASYYGVLTKAIETARYDPKISVSQLHPDPSLTPCGAGSCDGMMASGTRGIRKGRPWILEVAHAMNPLPSAEARELTPRRVRSSVQEALPSCARQAAVIYNVPFSAVTARLTSQSGGDPLNPMGLAPSADALLSAAGFDLRRVHGNVCWNEAAGVWLLAHMGIQSRGRPLTATVNPTPDTINTLIQQASSVNHIPVALIKAVMDQESQFHSTAVSPKSAQGLMQLIPSTANQYGVTNPFNSWQNINAGTAYLADLLRQFHGSIPLALAAYNAGPNAVLQAGGIPNIQETQRYVPSVISKYLLYTWQEQHRRARTPDPIAMAP